MVQMPVPIAEAAVISQLRRERPHGAAQTQRGADAGHHVRQYGGQPAEGGVVQVSHGPGTLAGAGEHEGGAFRKLVKCGAYVRWNDRLMLERAR
jgi:hypothetical protein